MKKPFAAILAGLLVSSFALTGCTVEKESGDNTTVKPFTPGLDTEASLDIEVASFFGNFEALDQVINHFNDFYPNVRITYNQYGSTSGDFLKENPAIDIMMTSNERGYNEESCVDLTAENVDTSAFQENVLGGNLKEGRLYSLPMGLKLNGLVVNKTLLAKEGLSVPQTWQEFLSVCETLKQKGFTPIQGLDSALSVMIYDMNMCLAKNDPALLNAITQNDAEGAAKLQTVYQRLIDLRDNGYYSSSVNAEYPANNYDGAILKFFEGNVPFWFCDTEKVSGMKKREVKSEAFIANSFEYEFIYSPMGDNGAYAYTEPWYGFAVNKNSDVKDYAVEFLRFLARESELNTLAGVKGIPSAAKNSSDDKYINLNDAKIELSLVNDMSVPGCVSNNLHLATDKLVSGETTTAESTLAFYLEKCYSDLHAE